MHECRIHMQILKSDVRRGVGALLELEIDEVDVELLEGSSVLRFLLETDHGWHIHLGCKNVGEE